MSESPGSDDIVLIRLIEAPVQEAITAAPQRYRNCRQVVIDFAQGGDASGAALSSKEMSVRFEDEAALAGSMRTNDGGGGGDE